MGRTNMSVASTRMLLEPRVKAKARPRVNDDLLVIYHKSKMGQAVSWHHAMLQLPQVTRRINPLTKTTVALYKKYSPKVAGKV